MRDVRSVTVGPGVSITKALAVLDRTGTGIVLVVDQQHHLIGTVTDGDVRRAILHGISLDESVTVLLDFRGKKPIVAHPTTPPTERLQLMQERSIRHLPILSQAGRVVELVLLSELSDKPQSSVSAIVFAGGYGTRLRPLTETLPKPMLPIGGRPLLERIVRSLAASGISDVRITTCFMAEKIKDHFGDGGHLGVHIRYIDEEHPLGTAGALGIIDRPEITTLAVNGDILTDLNFHTVVDFHHDHEADMTVAVRKYEFQVEYGVVESDGIETTGLVEKPSFQFFINAGIYVLEPAVFDYVPRGVQLDMPDLIKSLIADKRRVISFPIREYWLDVGRHDDYAQANDDFEGGKVRLELG